jgi:hypothetical protein
VVALSHHNRRVSHTHNVVGVSARTTP